MHFKFTTSGKKITGAFNEPVNHFQGIHVVVVPNKELNEKNF